MHIWMYVYVCLYVYCGYVGIHALYDNKKGVSVSHVCAFQCLYGIFLIIRCPVWNTNTFEITLLTTSQQRRFHYRFATLPSHCCSLISY